MECNSTKPRKLAKQKMDVIVNKFAAASGDSSEVVLDILAQIIIDKTYSEGQIRSIVAPMLSKVHWSKHIRERKEFYLWGETVEIYTSNLLTNAIVKEIIELENGTTKISYGEEDSRPMFISYKGFKTEKEAENEMKSIMENKEAYVNAKRLWEYLAEE